MKLSSPKNRIYLLLINLFLVATITSCNILDSWMLSEIENEYDFEYNLTDYELFKGDISQLIPNEGVVEFELTTPLFTDYALKQRLFKLPEGKSIHVNQDGTFSYPDSTLIAKTFYYSDKINSYKNNYSAINIGFPHLLNQESNKADMKNHIIETRLLYLIDGIWNVAVYEWNRDQSEAYLIKDGTRRDVSFVNDDGITQSTRYRIPSLAECTTCHQSNDKVVPIGPKLANMDHSINVKNETINHLDYLSSMGVLSNFDREGIDPFPKWNDLTQPLERRARAYLDVNCAHCHTSSGFADYSSLYLDYELPLSQTGINSRTARINNRINSRWRGEKMPLIGTTIIHQEGVELIQEYLEEIE